MSWHPAGTVALRARNILCCRSRLVGKPDRGRRREMICEVESEGGERRTCHLVLFRGFRVGTAWRMGDPPAKTTIMNVFLFENRASFSSIGCPLSIP